MALERIWPAYSRSTATPSPALDATAWASALLLAAWIRFDFSVEQADVRALLLVCVLAAGSQLLSGSLLSLYRGRYDVGSLDELLRVVASGLATTAIVAIPTMLSVSQVGLPRSLPLIAAPIAILAMGAHRFLQRVLHERACRRASTADPVIVYGAGLAGTSLAKQLRTDPASTLDPVGFLDDDPEQSGAIHAGVRVLGTSADLAVIASRTGASAVVVAVARADAHLLQRVSDAAAAAGLRVLVMPPLEEILEGRQRLTDLRDISIEDIVGRCPVDTDVATVAGYLTGRRVLVTGAGGSIGSELCRQIATFEPAELIMLDRDETALQAVELDVFGHGLLDTDDVVLADIRDAGAIRELMLERRPHVVFHAAALKHLPMLEQYPDEAWKTNVLGTRNVLEAAFAAGVEAFVNISTDKAANPTSVLGHSKQHAERLTAAYAARGRGRYLSVRFGNVLGSRGSMVPVFTRLIESGGPLTITHPDITRYFMTIPEACQLVVQAGGIGRPGEVLILDMGEPVKILDVAQRMIRMSGKQIDIVYTGLRPHEKLHEELIGAGEHGERPFHDKITHTHIEPLAPSELRKSTWDALWGEPAPQPRRRVEEPAAAPRPDAEPQPTPNPKPILTPAAPETGDPIMRLRRAARIAR